jgi:hypothetical protein
MNAPHDLQQSNEEWIAKYRAALDATLSQQSRMLRFRAALSHFCGVVASHLGKLAGEWMSEQWFTASAKLNPESPAKQKTTSMRKNQAFAERKGAVRKAS